MDFGTLSALSPGDLERLLAAASTRTFQRREIIFHAGDLGDTLFLIRSGHVAVRIVTEYGDSATLAVLGPQDSFGELALLSDGSRRSATVIALEPTQTWTLSRVQLTRARTERLAVDALLIQLLSNQVHRLTNQLVEALYVPVRHRVVRALLDLCLTYGEGPGPVTLLVTQDDVAGLTGAARPTVNQVLRTLQDAGAIGLRRGRIDVLDQAMLSRHRG